MPECRKATSMEKYQTDFIYHGLESALLLAGIVLEKQVCAIYYQVKI
jgi:hypothetical protein